MVGVIFKYLFITAYIHVSIQQVVWYFKPRFVADKIVESYCLTVLESNQKFQIKVLENSSVIVLCFL